MSSFSHVLASFSLGFHHRRKLLELLDDTPPNSSVLELDPEALHSSGIAAIVLDFDGVLAPHGEPAPLPEVVEWMKRSEAVFGGDHLFILSNKPTEERMVWFLTNFPAVRFISGVRKKPFPDGLKKTEELSGSPISSIIMVDDRLLTGCLASLVAGSRPYYIRRPYVAFNNRLFAELFFWLLRITERKILRLISIV